MKILLLITIGLFIPRICSEIYWWFQFNIYWPISFWWLGIGIRRLYKSGGMKFCNLKLQGKVPQTMSFKEWKKQNKNWRTINED